MDILVMNQWSDIQYFIGLMLQKITADSDTGKFIVDRYLSMMYKQMIIRLVDERWLSVVDHQLGMIMMSHNGQHFSRLTAIDRTSGSTIMLMVIDYWSSSQGIISVSNSSTQVPWWLVMARMDGYGLFSSRFLLLVNWWITTSNYD